MWKPLFNSNHIYAPDIQATQGKTQIPSCSFAIFAWEGIKHIWIKHKQVPLENVLKTSPLKAKKNMSNNQKRQHLNKNHSCQA